MSHTPNKNYAVLSPEEIQEFDQLNQEKDAIERTLNIAMTFAANRFEIWQIKNQKAWDRLRRVYNIETRNLILDRALNQVVVREMTQDEINKRAEVNV